MLNISPKRVNQYIDRSRFGSLDQIEKKRSGRVIVRLILTTFIVTLIVMFIPWTQNIRSEGNVTTLRPDQRPQTIHSVIGGRIEKWFVREGDYVDKGDTILYISEIKDEYFDPNLLTRTQEQLKSKEMAVNSYMEKVKALDNQIDAMIQTGELKLEQANNKLVQARLKITTDSIDYQAALTNYEISKEQYQRMQQLYKEGLKSLTDLENRNLTMQKAQASMISAQNKLLNSRNEEINARIEITSVQAQYRDDIAKAKSDKYTALSNFYDSEAVVTKLQNQYMNYSIRSGLYYILAPQNGYVTKAIQSGIGETVKEGESIVSIITQR